MITDAGYSALGAAGMLILYIFKKGCKKLHLHLSTNGVNINIDVDRPIENMDLPPPVKDNKIPNNNND